MKFNKENEYILYDEEITQVEPTDTDFILILHGDFLATLAHDEYDGRNDTHYMKEELEEDTLYLPFIGNDLMGSLFLVKDPAASFTWNGGADVKGFIFIEDIEERIEEKLSACFNVNGYKIWVDEKNINEFKETYELEFLGNVFDHEIQAFEDYELQRASIKECYLKRIIDTYRSQYQELELEKFERMSSEEFAELQGLDIPKEDL
jgi:hypothetical protein